LDQFFSSCFQLDALQLINFSKKGVFASLKKYFFAKLRLIPYVRNRINKELNKIKVTVEEEILKTSKNIKTIRALPDKG
jgi:hypothetical protein